MLDKFGIGIDIVKVSRFKNKPYLVNKKFYSKIFTNNEIKYCLNFKDPYPHFAGKFALKEATIKATRKKILIKEIETSHGKFDEPIVFSSKINDFHFESSLSHEEKFAIAVVISFSTKKNRL